MSEDMWDVWRVTYATYAGIELDGDVKPVRVTRRLRFAAAQALVAQLGFGHCAKPAAP